MINSSTAEPRDQTQIADRQGGVPPLRCGPVCGLWQAQIPKALYLQLLTRGSGGEAGIRTLGRGLCPFNGLANRRLQPLGHLTASAEPVQGLAHRRLYPEIGRRVPPGSGLAGATVDVGAADCRSGRAPQVSTAVPHSITHSRACGPDRYSGGAPAVISVSSSRMIETACPSHSGTAAVIANSSDTQSPSLRVIRGWSP